MDMLDSMSKVFMALIRAGAVTRVAYCFVKVISNYDEMEVYKKRGKNTVVFYILAECIWQIKDVLIAYFISGGSSGGATPII